MPRGHRGDAGFRRPQCPQDLLDHVALRWFEEGDDLYLAANTGINGSSRTPAGSAWPRSGCAAGPDRFGDCVGRAGPAESAGGDGFRLVLGSAAFRGPCSSTSRNSESGARPSAEWGTRYSGSGELGQEFQRVEIWKFRRGPRASSSRCGSGKARQASFSAL